MKKLHKKIFIATISLSTLYASRETTMQNVSADHLFFTYFVDSQNGDDFNIGTDSRPLKTIQAALDKVKVGARIFVRAGTYKERLVLKHSGTKYAPIIIEAQKDINGKRLVTIEGGDEVEVNWTIADEISPLVYKTQNIPYIPFSMSVDINGTSYDIPRLDWEFSKKLKYLDGNTSAVGTYGYKDVLALPSDKNVTTYYMRTKVNYWDGIEALYAYDLDTKTTYIRFRDGQNPNQMKLFSAPGSQNPYGNIDVEKLPMNESAAIKLENISYVTIKGFKINSAQNGILIFDENSSYNTIEDNEIINGARKISIAKKSHHNIIKNNTLHMELLSKYRPGAWWDAQNENLTKEELYKYAVAEHYYDVYKHEVGRITFSPEDDCGIFVDGAGSENKIFSNEIYDTLGGIAGSHSGKIYIYDNTLHHISSIATGLVDANIDEAYIYGNKMYDVNIGFRVQLNMNENNLQNLAKKAWFFKNIIKNPDGIGSNLFFSRDKNAPIPKSEYFPNIFIYHNTFVGAGNDAINVYGVADNIIMINNIFDGMKLNVYGDELGIVDYNWFNMNTNYKAHNISHPNIRIWINDDNLTNFSLPSNSDANEAGIDLSHKFVLNGKIFEPFPYMNDGYFNTQKPNIGAIQK